MAPQVSILIATLNAELTLDNALNSVITQSYQDWECIVIDGFSQDRTVDIIRRYAQSEPRIRYISEPDKGLFDALNKGLKMAKGTWIHCLGSDDKLTKDGISDLMKHTDSYDFVSGSTYIIFPNEKISILKSTGIKGCHQSMIIKKSVMYAVNGFDLSYKILADYKMLRQIEHYQYRICNIDSCISYFSMGGISQSLKYQLTICRENYLIGKEFGDKHPLLYATMLMVRKIISIIKRSKVRLLFA